ncbi:cell division protein FtsK [Streptomyces sp. NA02950]|uniref:FtsK/SpoIIIE domain-containing protein n=1 Tax=Streptomyces sp. NA02950 TaxID=2742137 RepID=UPI001590219F|nr:FtsK/SpoIIIE domain-containing protein [Streptomyces sp. NA02950]QKV94715.1 cell division protein FtsK [Streptomyces sp. NA02950]
MTWDWGVWLAIVLVLIAARARLGGSRLPRSVRRVAALPWVWYLAGFPVVALRMRFTWRKLARNADLAVARHHVPRALVGRDMIVTGRPLRPQAPRLGLPRPTRDGLVVRAFLHPGQTPGPYIDAAPAMAHAWRMHSVRVVSDRRGEVLITAVWRDPLQEAMHGEVPDPDAPDMPARVLTAHVGRTETGGVWAMDLHRVPHWLIVGATQSGKSTLLASLVRELATRPVALVGIDCKGGMELSLFERRLSALACSRSEAVALLAVLCDEAASRMAMCRAAGVRAIWDLPEEVRPVPVVVLVDEIAELYLVDGSKISRQEAAECSTYLLRIAQLGAALGLHLIVAGQRVGSELGAGVTALRAQLGGRVCHRVHDEATAEMALGDLAKDAIEVARTITEDEQGVAVTAMGGAWVRARSRLTSAASARRIAELHADLTPDMPDLLRAVISATYKGTT